MQDMSPFSHFSQEFSASSSGSSALKTIRVGLLGGGTVGGHVLQLLHKREKLFAEIGYRIEVAGVLVRDTTKPRPNLSQAMSQEVPLTDRSDFLNECAVVIEAMGGVETPLKLLRPYLRSGRALITANKALLAECWDELRPYALDGKIYYEASVMAGTPVIGPMSTVLRASTFTRLQAVLNGTCNYILSQMEQGKTYQEALSEAQALGYAEDPPTLDVSGMDTAHKLAVLARFCLDGRFRFEDISVQGIEHLTPQDIEQAATEGKRIKLVAELSKTASNGGAWQASVSPQILPAEHVLCNAAASRNALVFEGEECGPLTFAGGGAGGLVTASAMVGDLLDWVIGFPGHVPLHGSMQTG